VLRKASDLSRKVIAGPAGGGSSFVKEEAPEKGISWQQNTPYRQVGGPAGHARNARVAPTSIVNSGSRVSGPAYDEQSGQIVAPVMG